MGWYKKVEVMAVDDVVKVFSNCVDALEKIENYSKEKITNIENDIASLKAQKNIHLGEMNRASQVKENIKKIIN